MQAKIQRRFPAVRAYHRKRLVFDPDSSREESIVNSSDDEFEIDEDNYIRIDLPPSLSTTIGGRPPLPSPSSAATTPVFTPSITIIVPSSRVPTTPTVTTSSVPTRTPLSSTTGVPKTTATTASPSSSTSLSSPSPTATKGPSNEQSNVTPTGATKARSTPVGAIVGVLLAFFIIVVPIGIYLYRRRAVKGRLRLRNWTNRREKSAMISPWVDYREKWKVTEPSPAVTASDVRAGTPPGVPLANGLAYIPPPRPVVLPLATGYGTPSPGSPPSGSPRSITGTVNTPIVGATRVLPADVPEYATATSTFIPTLPDELSINPGDVLRILAEYDDGWALCLNPRREKGMVPLECFSRANPTTKREMRMSSRASSLAANPYDGIE